jgi:biopolymer transport protein ExbB/TolQ
MSAVLQFLSDSGFIGWCILAAGFCGIGLVAERFVALYRKFAMDGKAFSEKIQNLVMANKLDEALVTTHQFAGRPLAEVMKVLLEKSDLPDESIMQAHDNAMAEFAPLFSKRIHYLSMIANVATLLGLLGTIHGLILSFSAVSQADPSQKQALLAHGISVSMYDTALGLVVAIPSMVAYSFLVSRQNTLLEQLTCESGKLVELLTTSSAATSMKASVPVMGISATKETVLPPAPVSNVKSLRRAS